MVAVDSMPPPWRALVHEHGYIDVFRAWRRNWPIERVRAQAKNHGGLFIL